MLLCGSEFGELRNGDKEACGRDQETHGTIIMCSYSMPVRT